jgi:protein disulfide-isomerase A1
MVFRGVFILVSVLCVFSEISEEESVWVLTDSNFEEALEQQPNLLVEFYAPWCGHCKKLAPEYAQAAKKLLENDPPIRIAKVDSTENPEISKKFGVQGYPTLKYFIEKDPTEYSGGRTSGSIVEWILKKNKPSFAYVASLAELEVHTESDNVAVVLFAQKDSDEANTFEKVSKVLDGAEFIISTSPEALENFKVTEPSLVVFRKFDEPRVDYSGPLTQPDISKFVSETLIPLVIEFDERAIELIFKESNPVIFLFSTSYAEYSPMFTKLAKEFKGTILFSKADLFTTDNGRLAQFLGVTGESQPTSLILQPSTQSKFLISNEVSEENLRAFINDWKDEKLSAYRKSEKIPEESHENNVRVLVGKNFADVVYDSTKNVLVEFYAPWCGHCKQLVPEYEKLATELKGYDNIVIAKIDATANEVQGEDIRGFPTIRFYAASDKKSEEFSGNRDYEGLLSFIKEKVDLKLPETAGTPDKADL